MNEISQGSQVYKSQNMDPDDTDDSLGRVLEEICQERARQDVKWGGTAHDDRHDSQDWAQFITYQNQAIPYEANLSVDREEYDDVVRRRFIKIAALAVAAIQSIDRKSAALLAAQEGPR